MRAAAVTVGELKRWAERELGGIPSPRADAGPLTAAACGLAFNELPSSLSAASPPGAEARLAGWVSRRRRREPLQLIIGSAPFLDLDIDVAPGVFIPRPETEGLAFKAAKLITALKNPVVVDLCCGAGPIAIYLARKRPDARLVGVEIEAKAAAWATRNAAKYAAAVEIREDDIQDASLASRLPRADLIVANPPYIKTATLPALPPEVRVWDPAAALDGGADGLQYYPAIAALAARLLRAGGAAAVEIGEGQAGAVAKIFAEVGPVEIGRDLAGRDRYVWARRAGETT